MTFQSDPGAPGNPLSITERGIQVARGLVTGADVVSSYGEMTTTGAVTDHLLWPYLAGTSLVVPPAPGVQMSLASSNAQDGVSGTGIRSVVVLYLDGNLNPQSETVVLNGTTPVPMVATDVRFVQCTYMLTYGSGKAAAGNISVSNAGTVYSYIATGDRRCSSSARRVPAGKQMIVDEFYAGACLIGSAATTVGAIVRLVSTEINGTDFSEQAITFPRKAFCLQDVTESLSGLALSFPAGAVVALEATTDNDATIAGGFGGWFENVPT